uniref:Aquaporin n=1 Tax=Ditylenchus dipsaci TaxID=166011 RepID=A0A915D6Q7_9BILA
MFWSIGLHRNHSEMLDQKDCNTDLTVTILYADFQIHSLACALTSGLITVIGIHLTGMYANPIVAWACTFNCGEVSHVAHFCVYWWLPSLLLSVRSTPAQSKDEHKEGEKKKVR